MAQATIAANVEARRWTAAAFERACRLTGLDNGRLCEALAKTTGRNNRVAGQTLLDWRKGVNAVPFEIFAAACYLARVDPRAVIGLATEASGLSKRGWDVSL